MKPSPLIFRNILAIALLVGLSGCAGLVSHGRDGERAALYLQLAADEFNNRNFNKALEATLESLKFKTSPEGYNHLALIYMETKRYQKAEEAFKKAIEMNAEYPEVYNNTGVLMNRQERYAEAVPYFEKALTYESYKTPENAMTNLGFAQFKLGNNSLAKQLHQRALDVVPQFCLAEKNLGDVYAKEKNYNKASDYYERAVTNCPLFQESQYKLGLVLMKMGQRSVAKLQLEKLIQKHKKGPYVDRSHEVLKYLQ